MAVNIGPKIGVDGEKEYRQQMQSIIQQTKTLAAEMKTLTSGFGLNATAAKQSQEASRVLTAQIQKQKEAISQMTGMLQKSTSAWGESDTRTQKYQQNVYNAQAELAKMETELRKVNSEMRVEQSVAEATSSTFGKLKSNVALATNEKKANKAIVSSLKSEYAEAKARVSALTQEIVKSAESQGDHAEETKDLAKQLQAAREEMNRLGSELRDAQQKSRGLSAAFASIGEKAKAAVSGGVNVLGNAIKTGFKGSVHIGISAAQAFTKAVVAVGAAVAACIVALGKIGLEYNMEMESYQTNFETMLGSEEAAVKKVSELKEMAAKTPFEMGDLADATQQLLAMGVASEDTGKYLQQLGDISLGDKEKLNSLVNAFGKMNSTGKVTLEYINMMAEQGFNPLNVIAQQTGESMTDLYARVSAGKVSLDEIKNAMQVATSAGGQFAGGMEKASKTTQGMISTLKDNAKALVGEVYQPISDGLKNQLLPSAIDAIDRLTTEFRENGINGMIAAASDIIGETIGQFASSLPEFVTTALDIVESLGAGIKNNQSEIADGVVKTITTLVSGLLAALPVLLKTGGSLLLEIARGIAKSLPEIVVQAADIVAELVNSLWTHRWDILQAGADIVNGIMAGIASVWQSLVDWFNGLWSSLFSGRSVDVRVNAHAGGGGSFDGSHANGLDYVPWDNYIANLHKGEMVLTRNQADMLRNTGYMYLPQNGGGGQAQSTQKVYNFSGFSIQIYQQPGEDEDALLDRLEDRMQTKVMREVAAVGG